MQKPSSINTLIFAGKDKLGKTLLQKVRDFDGIFVALDGSEKISRGIKLIFSGSISFVTAFKIFLAEFSRPKVKFKCSNIFINNAELSDYIHKNKIRRLILFRAGLIIDKALLKENVQFLNVHCARIPEYRGLGAIDLALKGGSFDQIAVMHRVTSVIDSGEIVATRKFRLNPKASFKENENIAYKAGIDLIIEQLKV